MSTRKLRRVPGIEQATIEKLQKHKITNCRDLLLRNPLELLTLTDLSYGEVQDLIRTVSKCVVPQSKTALEIKQLHKKDKPYFLSMSLPSLDNILLGGLHSSTLTEVTGPPGSGKTQFSILLTIMATLPHEMGGLNGHVIYIDTEAAFTAQRLVEMAKARFPDVFGTSQKQRELLAKVHLFLESTCLSLLWRLENLEEEIITNGVKLIILDSIASLVRKEFDTRTSKSTAERTALLSKEATILKYIAEKFEIPVLATNQITTIISRTAAQTVIDEDDNEAVNDEEQGHITAALGNTWAHSVNTRLTLQYLNDEMRQIMITKSPMAPFKVFTYSIQKKGIVLIETDQDFANSRIVCYLYKWPMINIAGHTIQSRYPCSDQRL